MLTDTVMIGRADALILTGTLAGASRLAERTGSFAAAADYAEMAQRLWTAAGSPDAATKA